MDDKDNNDPAARDSEKIQKLKEMIQAAEKTLQGAKVMLLQLEGKKKLGRKRMPAVSEEGEGTIIEGTFDGQVMVGTDRKQYPVPANYASKSKLIEGDLLKLTITPEGSFIYKQIGPAERKKIIGLVNQDAEGNYFIIASGKPYRVLLASITYFKVNAGDEVVLVVPKDVDSDWGAIENVIKKAPDFSLESEPEEETPDIHALLNREESFKDSPKKSRKKKDTIDNHASIIDEWTPDIDELKKELNDNTEL